MGSDSGNQPAVSIRTGLHEHGTGTRRDLRDQDRVCCWPSPRATFPMCHAVSPMLCHARELSISRVQARSRPRRLTSRSAPGAKTGDRAESVSKPFVLGVSKTLLRLTQKAVCPLCLSYLLPALVSKHQSKHPEMVRHKPITNYLSATRPPEQINQRPSKHLRPQTAMSDNSVMQRRALHPHSPPISDARHLPSSAKL